jgi:hypothetical protein
MIREDQLDRLREIISRARAAGNDEVVAKAIDLLSQAAVQAASEGTPAPLRPKTSAMEPDPITRARTREDDALHNLRRGRDRCAGTRRDGQPCQAPAIEGGTVCRRHGGAAPQVQIAARHHELQLAMYVANREFQEARGTPAEFDALCRALQAGRDLDAYELKMEMLTELRAELRRKRALGKDQGDATGTP